MKRQDENSIGFSFRTTKTFTVAAGEDLALPQ